MKRSRFSEEQSIAICQRSSRSVVTAEVCRKRGVSAATFYKWKAKFGGMGVSDDRRLRTLQAENAQLKKQLAEAMLDNAHPERAHGEKGDARRQKEGSGARLRDLRCATNVCTKLCSAHSLRSRGSDRIAARLQRGPAAEWARQPGASHLRPPQRYRIATGRGEKPPVDRSAPSRRPTEPVRLKSGTDSTHRWMKLWAQVPPATTPGGQALLRLAPPQA